MKPGKITVIDCGDKKTLEYNIKYATGIYVATEASKVIANCRLLDITLKELNGSDFYEATVTKLDACAIGTCIIGEKTVGYTYAQYILTEEAQSDYVNQLMKDGPNQHYEELIIATFQAVSSAGEDGDMPF